MEAAKKAKQVQQALVHEQQIDAVKQIYKRSVDIKLFGLSFPSLSHLKKHLVACAETLSPGLSEHKLHREICKRLKLPVPEGCYSDSEMREALLGFHFRKVDKLTVATFTDQFGPSKASLFRQYGRLVDALKLAGVQSSSGLEKAGLGMVHTVSFGFARRCSPAHTVSIGRSCFY